MNEWPIYSGRNFRRTFRTLMSFVRRGFGEDMYAVTQEVGAGFGVGRGGWGGGYLFVFLFPPR